MYRAMCNASGQYVKDDPKLPLHDCDFEGSKVVGDKLRAGLSLGLSKHWKKSLKEMTGEDDLSADAILEYFEPLYKFLKSHNEKGTLSRRISRRSVSVRVFKEGVEGDYLVCGNTQLNI